MDSISKLVHTPKTLGIIFDERYLFIDPPDPSLLHKMSKKKRILLGLKMEEDVKAVVQNIPSYVFFTKSDSLLFIFSVLAAISHTKNLVAFSEYKSYHESLGFFYMRRNLDEERKQFIRSR